MELIKKIGTAILRLMYIAKYKNIKLAIGCKILPGSVFHGHNSVQKGSTFFGELGHDSYIGCDSFIYAEIGKYTSIGDRVKCIFANHPINGFVSTSPVFYSLKKQNGHTYVEDQLFNEVLYQDGKKVPVIIGSDVWIGSDVTFVGRITINDGAVVAAGAVVTEDVMPYTIVGGVPAKVIKKRFTEKQIKKLCEIRWWDWDENDIMKMKDKFVNIDEFLKDMDLHLQEGDYK